MSTERGNNKKNGQKYKNQRAFKNDLYDTSKKLKEINSLEFHGLCEHCKGILDWKVKYKKYKPLTMPKKCVKCLEKKVKVAYYIVCQDCCLKDKICSKCAQSCEQVSFGETEVEKIRREQQFQYELKTLSERQRRKFLRLLEKGVFTKENLTDGTGLVSDRLKINEEGDEEDDGDFDDLDDQMNACKEVEKKVKFRDQNNTNADNGDEENSDDYEDYSDDDDDEEEEE